MAPLHHLNETAFDHVGRIERIDPLALIENAALGDGAPLGFDEVGDRLQGRGFSGPVGPEQGHDSTLGNLERNPPQHQDHVIVDHFDIVDAEEGAPISCHRFSQFVPTKSD